jgi:hypothetical protein
VMGIRRLFLPHVGMRGSAKHLFEEFQNSLWDGRENYQDVPQERRASDHSQLHELGGRRRDKPLGRIWRTLWGLIHLVTLSIQKKKANRSLRTVGVFLFVPIAAEPGSLLKEAG